MMLIKIGISSINKFEVEKNYFCFAELQLKISSYKKTFFLLYSNMNNVRD